MEMKISDSKSSSPHDHTIKFDDIDNDSTSRLLPTQDTLHPPDSAREMKTDKTVFVPAAFLLIAGSLWNLLFLVLYHLKSVGQRTDSPYQMAKITRRPEGNIRDYCLLGACTLRLSFVFPGIGSSSLCLFTLVQHRCQCERRAFPESESSREGPSSLVRVGGHHGVA